MTDINKDVVVGDLTSDAVGSGARKNGGKPDYGLLPMKLLIDNLGTDYAPNYGIGRRYPLSALLCLAVWQRRGCKDDLLGALKETTGSLTGWHFEMFRECVDVLAYGKAKYAPWNWAKGMPWSVPFACAIRHLIALSKGEEIDPESGCSHWGHVQANLLMLLLYTEKYPELNDMPFGVLKNGASI